jgi:hypothetical protein
MTVPVWPFVTVSFQTWNGSAATGYRAAANGDDVEQPIGAGMLGHCFVLEAGTTGSGPVHYRFWRCCRSGADRSDRIE